MTPQITKLSETDLQHLNELAAHFHSDRSKMIRLALDELYAKTFPKADKAK